MEDLSESTCTCQETDKECSLHHSLKCRCRECELLKSVSVDLAKSVLEQENPMPGMYGCRGWTVLSGVTALILGYSDWRWLSRLEKDSELAMRDVNDYLAYFGGDAWLARQLLTRLYRPCLDDRQNNGPSLGAVLKLCRDHPTIEFEGYAIGPQRCDERVTADAVYVPPEVLGYGGQDSSRAYQALLDLGLDPLDEADEIMLLRQDSKRCWRFWWD